MGCSRGVECVELFVDEPTRPAAAAAAAGMRWSRGGDRRGTTAGPDRVGVLGADGGFDCDTDAAVAEVMSRDTAAAAGENGEYEPEAELDGAPLSGKNTL